MAAVHAGRPAFRPVTRFDVGAQRASSAGCLSDATDLSTELAGVVDEACRDAGLTGTQRADSPLLLAMHAEPDLVRTATPERAVAGAAGSAVALASRTALGTALRTYTTGCVAASNALVDAARMIATGAAERVVVAAGYLVDADYFLAFDAGRALSVTGLARPFSTGRDGMVLADAVVAVVLEDPLSAERRGAPELARLAGWGRAGDAFHVCQPEPDGSGMARAVTAALRHAGLTPDDLGYLNAHGTGTVQSDRAETRALHTALGEHATRIPLSSTKSVHGHTLEASALLEFVITVLTLRSGRLPVNAGYLGPDDECRALNLVLAGTAGDARYALSLNSAFGGANTALVVRA
ncbi:MAG: beta-ketoacyl synthase N-terminal-like domain-containing protein [Actinocatenispora sp.]